MLKRVVVFGGNGFLGSRVLEFLVARAGPETLVSISRRGEVPAQARDKDWARKVDWRKGDALDPQTFRDMFDAETGVLISIGTPPLPTLSEAQHAKQVKANGETCKVIINAAAERKVPRIVLIGATMPAWAPSGYRQGKEEAMEAVRAYVDDDPTNTRSALVFQPATMYGTRYTQGGTPIPLGLVMAPASMLLRGLDSVGVIGALKRTLPYLTKGAVEPPVPVENVSRMVASALVADNVRGFKLVTNAELLSGKLDDLM